MILINPSVKFLDNPFAQPPLGILYIASVLRENGHHLELIDLNEKKFSKLSKINNEIVGISSMTATYPEAKKILRVLKKNDNTVIIGGVHPSIRPKECLNDRFDIVVQGEGERAIINILKNIRGYKGFIYHNSFIRELDTIPFPARDMINYKKYYQEFENGRATTIIPSRGCPYTCGFCCKQPWGYRVRRRSIGNVITEIQECMAKYDYTRFVFEDDTFTFNRKWTINLCKELQKLDILWRCLTRTDKVDKELLKFMYYSGCREIAVGIESGSDKILTNINKKTTRKINIECVKIAHDARIKVKAFLILGLPGENKNTLKETETWMEEAQPDWFDITLFKPYPGCDIRDNPNRYDIKILPMPYEESWFKGNIKSFVATSQLSATDLENARAELLDKFLQISNKAVRQ